jgi:hypothetical protein
MPIVNSNSNDSESNSEFGNQSIFYNKIYSTPLQKVSKTVANPSLKVRP